MKKLTALILTLALTLSLTLPAQAASVDETTEDLVRECLSIPASRTVKIFKDTDNFTVNFLYNLGIVNGTGDGKFLPLGTITRAEFAQIVYRAFTPEDERDAVGYIIKADGTREIAPWWTAAEWFLFEKAIQPLYDKIPVEEYSKLCLSYYDGNIEHEFQPGESASYEWMVRTLYLIWANNGGAKITSANIDSLVDEWATERGAGVNGRWRNVSNGRFVTRLEACELFAFLCELS